MKILFSTFYAALGAGAGWAAFQAAGLEIDASVGAGVAVFLILMCLHAFIAAGVMDAEREGRVDSLERRYRDADDRLAVVQSRIDTVEATVKKELSDRHDSLVAEMRQLEGLIARLSRNFEAGKKLNGAAHANGEKVNGHAPDDVLRAVRDALKQGRVDLHLQPVVSLPQRRVAFYEGFTRLRRDTGELIPPADFLDAARRAKLAGVIENIAMYRCIQIVRKLAERDRRVGVFCTLTTDLLGDAAAFAKLRSFMADNRDLSGAVIFETPYEAFEHRTRDMRDNMDALAELGFRYSLDGAPDLGADLPRLQDAGVRFMKIDGAALLQQLRDPEAPRPMANVRHRPAPEEVAAVFARHGVTLIADQVDEEAAVVDLLEYEIPYGQGAAFGAPRPIKSSLMRETAPPKQFVDNLVAAR